MNANVKQQSMGINQSAVNQLPGREKTPGREWSKWLLIKIFIVWLFALVLYIPDHAQEVMKIGSYIEVERQYDKFIDLVLPTADILASGWGLSRGQRSRRRTAENTRQLCQWGRRSDTWGLG